MAVITTQPKAPAAIAGQGAGMLPRATATRPKLHTETSNFLRVTSFSNLWNARKFSTNRLGFWSRDDISPLVRRRFVPARPSPAPTGRNRAPIPRRKGV